MGVDFDAALGLLHSACDSVFAVPARFRPQAGAPATCVVERFRPAPEFGLDDTKIVTADELLRLQRSALPQRPEKGDVFELLGPDGVSVTAKLRVIAAPTVEDDDGLRWTVKVEKV